MRIALVLAALAISSGCAAQEGINWLGDIGEARRIAKETGKPIFLEFRCES